MPIPLVEEQDLLTLLVNDSQLLKAMRGAADLETSTGTPPLRRAIIPARELLAELLLDLGKRDDAIAEARRVLRDAPNRRNAMGITEPAMP